MPSLLSQFVPNISSKSGSFVRDQRAGCSDGTFGVAGTGGGGPAIVCRDGEAGGGEGTGGRGGGAIGATAGVKAAGTGGGAARGFAGSAVALEAGSTSG